MLLLSHEKGRRTQPTACGWVKRTLRTLLKKKVVVRTSRQSSSTRLRMFSDREGARRQSSSQRWMEWAQALSILRLPRWSVLRFPRICFLGVVLGFLYTEHLPASTARHENLGCPRRAVKRNCGHHHPSAAPPPATCPMLTLIVTKVSWQANFTPYWRLNFDYKTGNHKLGF